MLPYTTETIFCVRLEITVNVTLCCFEGEIIHFCKSSEQWILPSLNVPNFKSRTTCHKGLRIDMNVTALIVCVRVGESSFNVCVCLTTVDWVSSKKNHFKMFSEMWQKWNAYPVIELEKFFYRVNYIGNYMYDIQIIVLNWCQSVSKYSNITWNVKSYQFLSSNKCSCYFYFWMEIKCILEMQEYIMLCCKFCLHWKKILIQNIYLQSLYLQSWSIFLQ